MTELTITLTKKEKKFLLEALTALAYDVAWGTPQEVTRLLLLIEKLRT